MDLLVVVLNEEELLPDLITGWLDIGVTGATVLDSTDSVQLISHHVPIFAGFRALTSGGMRHNKTLFAVMEEPALLEKATAFLEALCLETGDPSAGIYFTVPLSRFSRLGLPVSRRMHREHLAEKLGRPL